MKKALTTRGATLTVMLALVGVLPAYWNSHKAAESSGGLEQRVHDAEHDLVALREKLASLSTQQTRICEDIDFNQERMDAIEADYGGQFGKVATRLKEVTTKIWTTNRIFRTQLEALERKVNE